MGSRSSSSSSSSSRSSRSAYSSASSRYVGGGSNIELCEEKYTSVLKIWEYKYGNGFILDTEYYYYGFKFSYDGNNFSSTKTKNWDDIKYFFVGNNSNFDYDVCDVSSCLTLGEIEVKASQVIQLIREGKCSNFRDKLLEKLKTHDIYNSDLKNRSVSAQICKDRNQRIISVTKIVIPYSGRGAVQAGRVVASIFTLGLINISEDLRQNLEHHGLIFETDDFYYVVQYTDGGIKTKRSKNYQDCKQSIKDCGIDPYDIWEYSCGFSSYLTLEDIERKVNSLVPYFNESNYHSLKNNCQYFVKDLLEKIN